MAKRVKKEIVVEVLPTKLRFGAGEEEGFKKFDSIWLLESIPADSVEIVYLSGIFHHFDQEGRYKIANEIFRVLKSGGQWMSVVPYWNTRRFLADPLSKWPGICEESFYVYSKEWRENQVDFPEIAALPLTCDFTQKAPNGMFVVPAGHEPEGDVGSRNEEFRGFAARFYNNAVANLHVTLTKP